MNEISPILVAFWVTFSALALIMLTYKIITHGGSAHWAAVFIFSSITLVLEYLDSQYVIIPLLGLLAFYAIIFLHRKRPKQG